jgi:hypothetical protein
LAVLGRDVAIFEDVRENARLEIEVRDDGALAGGWIRAPDRLSS